MNYKRLPFSKTENCRDLGGYATEDGVTKFGVFFRSACPHAFDQSDCDLFRQMNVGSVVDLRGGSNADETLCVPNFDGVVMHKIALNDGTVPRFAEQVPQSYLDMLDNTQCIRQIFHVFATEKRATLFHCFAGKDRTGVVAALLLGAVGVSDVDIVADYCLTYPYFLPRLRQDFSRTDAEKYVFVPIPEHMENFLKLLREKYGSVWNYLLFSGVTQEELQAIKLKFVQPVSFCAAV